jgi:hypothetical protein
MKWKFFLVLILPVFLVSSCKKDEPVVPQVPGTMKELKVPGNFTWKTNKEIRVAITASSAGLAEVTNENGIACSKAFITAGKAYTMKVALPSYQKKIHLRFQGKEVTLDITSDLLQYSFN